ncbi:MAG: hypothetical protein AAFY71_10750 [Bacteroidota bacterium]
MKMVFDDELNIYCGGFYSLKGTYSAAGSYFFKIDPKLEKIEPITFHKFDVDFLTQNMTEKEKGKIQKKASKGKNVEPIKYRVKQIILKNNGGVLLVGEQFYTELVSSTESSAVYTFYYYNDIVAISLSKDNQIEWQKRIPKKQTSKNDGGRFSSFATIVSHEKTYFVYNDHAKNLAYKGTGKIHMFDRGSESIVALTSIDHQGKQEKEILFYAKEAGVFVQSDLLEFISERDMILFGSKKKNYRLAKVSFKE